MATRILHFGVDERAILASLANGGYEVEECGTSVPNLTDALRRCQSDAVVVESDGVALGDDVVASARSLSDIPFILFQGVERAYDISHFDLVIPPRTPSKNWLKEIDELIERTRAVRTKTRSALERSTSLLQQPASLMEAAFTLHVTAAHAGGLRVKPPIERVPVKCILIVDDYAPWRQRLRSMLHDYAELQSVAEAANGLDAVRTARELIPDLILLDLHLPRLNGIEAARQICHFAPDATILFLSMNKDTDIVREAMNTGARGYVLKTDAGSELWPAIETVLLRKGQYLSSGVQSNAESEP